MNTNGSGYIILLLLLLGAVLVGCIGKSARQEKTERKNPGSFFSEMKNLLSGKQGEIIQQVEKDIQAWLDEHHPEMGLQVTGARNLGSLAGGSYDNYGFTAVDTSGLKVNFIWNNFREDVAPGFIDAYQKFVLHKGYTDTLRSKIPEDIPVYILYRTKTYQKEPDDYLRFYIFCPEEKPENIRKAYIIENIRKGLHETLQAHGKTHYEASLCFILPSTSDKEIYALDEVAEMTTQTWLVTELREENEKEIPDSMLGGKVATKMKEKIKQQLTGSDSYTYPEYFLIRQDNFSELFYLTQTERPDKDSVTYIYGIFTSQLVLKEKKAITIPKATGYKYKDLEHLIPKEFQYRHIPEKSLRSAIEPFYNPYFNPY